MNQERSGPGGMDGQAIRPRTGPQMHITVIDLG